MGWVGYVAGAAPDAVVGTKLEHPGCSQLLPARRSAGLGLVIGALRVVVALLVGDVLDVVVIGLSDRVDDEQGFTQALGELLAVVLPMTLHRFRDAVHGVHNAISAGAGVGKEARNGDAELAAQVEDTDKNGRASCRERVCQYV